VELPPPITDNGAKANDTIRLDAFSARMVIVFVNLELR
jgi:hypothetical protein